MTLIGQPLAVAEASHKRAEFDAALVSRGAKLAAIGDCAGCHTAVDGAPLAGGVPLSTPFGTIYGANITPDSETGIGDWSQTAFVGAMRHGVSRDGRHLYPAFPFDHFAHTTDDELYALYAYLMTRQPIRTRPPPNEVAFPLNFRGLLAVWDLLYLDANPYTADTKQDAQWNRGAYLVNSLGHCGSCHTPRDALGAEQRSVALQGSEIEGWYAPAIERHSPSPVPWTREQMGEYLRTGLAPDHAMAGGPMQGVVENLAEASDADIDAISLYVTSLMEFSPDEGRIGAQINAARVVRLPTDSELGGQDAVLGLGASVYAGACAACHDRGRRLSSSSALLLQLAVAAYEPNARSLIRIVREGIVPKGGAKGRWMPAFGRTLTDEQLFALATYLRKYAANGPAWADLDHAVRDSAR
jgi:mono/diheme cytochrome c family protein